MNFASMRFLMVVVFLFCLEFLLSLYLASVLKAMPNMVPLSPFSDVFFQRFTPIQPSIAPQVNLPDGKRCIVYDRPPRTASTTISRTLKQCLSSIEYVQPPWRGKNARSEDIPNMLDLPQADVGLVSRHFFLNSSTLQKLYKRCGSLLYITSTAPMKERIWSITKYRQMDAHGNGTLSDAQMRQATADVREQQSHVKLLNSYPFWKNMETALDTTHIERPLPDYVIRKSQLAHDFRALLQALGCDTEVRSDNIHDADDQHVLKDLQIEDDDGLHRRMLLRAEKYNHRGLQSASRFSQRR